MLRRVLQWYLEIPPGRRILLDTPVYEWKNSSTSLALDFDIFVSRERSPHPERTCGRISVAGTALSHGSEPDLN
jgi:hypothetical protein